MSSKTSAEEGKKSPVPVNIDPQQYYLAMLAYQQQMMQSMYTRQQQQQSISVSTPKQEEKGAQNSSLVTSNELISSEDGEIAGERRISVEVTKEELEEIEKWRTERKAKHPCTTKDGKVKNTVEVMKVSSENNTPKRQKKKKKTDGDFDTYKTKPCRYFLKGKCHRGSSCTYIHAAPEKPVISSFGQQKEKHDKLMGMLMDEEQLEKALSTLRTLFTASACRQ